MFKFVIIAFIKYILHVKKKRRSEGSLRADTEGADQWASPESAANWGR